jgi:predicted phosphodiesterase
VTGDDRDDRRGAPGASAAPGVPVGRVPDGGGSRPHARAVLALLLRVALVLLVIGATLQLLAAGSYLVPAGSVTFQLRPAWPGGHLVMPLGPAGELALRTHRTPVDVVMDYRLPEQTAALLDGGASRELPRLAGGARAAFDRYLAGRVPWLFVAGAAAGLLVAGHHTRRRLLWGLLGGGAAALLLGGAFALVTYATLDRSPAVRYSGLASRVPAMLPLLRALSTGGDQSDRLSRLQDFLDGLEAVATQLTTEPRRPARADVVRLLLASDIHDNVFGARAAARLAAGGGEPVDGVLLAGDLTDTGSAEEARLFLRVFGPRRAPVLLAGGNHEDAPALRVFRRAGFVVLDDTTVSIAGVRVLGASDPVSGEARVASDVQRLATAGVRLESVWRLSQPQPQVVLVHDERQAQATIDSAQAAGAQLLVAYGNDHAAGVSSDDGVVRVDAGTAGASGYEAIGAASAQALEPPSGSRDVYTYQLIDFARADPRQLTGVTTVSYAGGGRTVVTYTPFGP